MIYENVELHNVAEVREMPDVGGVRLQRVPEELRLQLNEGAQMRMLSPACAEIRFVSEEGRARVTLSCLEDQTSLVIFYGPFQVGGIQHLTGHEKTLVLTVPERLRQIDRAALPNTPWAPDVVRVMMAGGAVALHGVEGQGIRPPSPEELPRLRYLAYGTSITHGGAASGPHLSYAGQTARRLGADLINLGVGGSAYCEPELAEYIGSRSDWDMATLALSVNMIGAGFSLDAFQERVSYMVNRVAGSDTERPVAAITIYPHFRDLDQGLCNPADKGTTEQYRQALRDAVAQCPHPNVTLIEGSEIMDDISGLTPDLIHPADNGMIRMGENLARRLEPLLKRGG
jgi:lysophospholipase L1-like esterase